MNSLEELLIVILQPVEPLAIVGQLLAGLRAMGFHHALGRRVGRIDASALRQRTVLQDLGLAGSFRSQVVPDDTVDRATGVLQVPRPHVEHGLKV